MDRQGVGEVESLRTFFQRRAEIMASALAHASDGSIPSARVWRESVSLVGRREPRSMKVIACRFSPVRRANSPSDKPNASRVSRRTTHKASESSVAN